jgi:hypothetical protein
MRMRRRGESYSDVVTIRRFNSLRERAGGSLTVCPPARRGPPASFCLPIALRFALGQGWQFEGESFLQLGPDAVDGAGSDRATRRERRGDGLQKRRSQRWGNWAGELE